MHLKNYLENAPKTFTLIDSKNIDVDWVYSEDFTEKISHIDKIFFHYTDLEVDIFDNEGIMGIFSLTRSREVINNNNICIVVDYIDKSSDHLIDELYDNLNLWKIPLFIAPGENFVEEDYINYLSKILDILLSKTNGIAINPVYSFIQYVLNNILIEDFITNKEDFENIKNPTPPSEITELFINRIGEDRGNQIKNRLLEKISDRDREDLKEIITVFLNNLKNNLEKEKDNLGLTLINEKQS